MKLLCPVCENFFEQNERFCAECGSVQRHRTLVEILKKYELVSKDIKVLIVSEGKRANNKYYETAYFLSEKCKLTTCDIISHTTYFKDQQFYDLYENLESLYSIEDNTFDLIICMHVLTAVENDITAFKEISRVLKQDGTFIMNDGVNKDKESELYIAETGQYTRRYYGLDNLKELINKFFSEVNVIEGVEFSKENYEGLFFICKNKKSYVEFGSSTPIVTTGFLSCLPEKIFIFNLGRCGGSSTEIALQQLGYETLFLDHGRSLLNKNTMNNYNMILKNIKNHSPLLYNVNANAIIMSTTYCSKVGLLFAQYPGSKIICMDRSDIDALVKSVKNHDLCVPSLNRPNPKRKDIIYQKEQFINDITKQIEHINKKESFLLYDCCNKDTDENKWKKLCSFLNKPVPSIPFPHISTNPKIELSDEILNY